MIQQPEDKSLYNHEINLGMHTISMACAVAICTVVTGFGFHHVNGTTVVTVQKLLVDFVQ